MSTDLKMAQPEETKKEPCPPWNHRIEKSCMKIVNGECRYLVNPPKHLCEQCHKRFDERANS